MCAPSGVSTAGVLGVSTHLYSLLKTADGSRVSGASAGVSAGTAGASAGGSAGAAGRAGVSVRGSAGTAGSAAA